MSMLDVTPTQVNRPGCITAYAILLWIGGAIYIIGALCVGLGGLTPLARPSGVNSTPLMVPLLVGAVCIGLFALIPLAMGIGLWQMKSWAWWLVVILESLGLAYLVLNLCSLFIIAGSGSRNATGSAVGGFIGTLLGGLINGGILYWFLNNRSLFTGGAGAQVTSSGNTGVIVAVIAVVVGLVVAVPVVVIVILALLGPAISNVFSNIMISI